MMEKLKFGEEPGKILKLRLEENHLILKIKWKNRIEQIELEAEKIYWENCPDFDPREKR